MPTLIGALLSMRGASQQVMLDSLTRSLVACTEDGDGARCISDRGFAQARDKLSWGGSVALAVSSAFDYAECLTEKA